MRLMPNFGSIYLGNTTQAAPCAPDAGTAQNPRMKFRAMPHNSGAQIAPSEILSEATKTGMKADAFMRIFVNSDGIYASKLCAKQQA